MKQGILALVSLLALALGFHTKHVSVIISTIFVSSVFLENLGDITERQLGSFFSGLDEDITTIFLPRGQGWVAVDLKRGQDEEAVIEDAIGEYVEGQG